MLRLVIELVVLIAYFAVGIRLTLKAERHLLHPSDTPWVTPLLDASRFSEEGKRLRKKALLFWDTALVLLVLYWLIA